MVLTLPASNAVVAAVALAQVATLASAGCLDVAATPLARAITQDESSGNRFAIGIVGARLQRQPRNLGEAVATAQALEALGMNYSLGCRQINRTNLARYGLTTITAFDPKQSARVGDAVFGECLSRATRRFPGALPAVRAALSCYYAGDFVRGQRPRAHAPSYVDRVLARLDQPPRYHSAAVMPVATRAANRAGVGTGGGWSTPTTASPFETLPEKPAPPRGPDHKPEQDWDIFNDF